MIVYRKGISIRVLLRISGSVMPRAAVNALLSAALTYLISCVIPPEVLLQLFNHPYPFQPMAHVVAFALVFRTNVAYNRYWESCTEVCLMSAKWGDTFAEALSFDELSKPRAADAPPLSGEERAQAHRERRLSQARLVHLASLMHALALQYLRRDDDLGKLVSAEVAEPAAAAAAAAAGEWAGATLHLPTAPGTTSRPTGVERDGSDEDRAQEQTMEEVGAASPSSLPSPSEVLAAARRLGRRGAGLTQEVNVWPPLPVLGGVGSEEALDLEFSEDRVSTLFALVLRHLNERRLAGGLWADAPVLSRVFQVLSDGNLGFRQARKIEDVPFPWPYAQMVAFLLLTFSVTFPLMVASQMAQLPEQGLAVGLERPAQSLFERGIVGWTPPLLTFLTIMGYSGLYSTASVLEDPFVHPPNDLPSVAMQRAFNAQLLTSWDALRPPPPPPDGAKEGGAPDAAAVAAAVLRGPPPECTAAASAAACVPALEWEATCRLWLAWEARWLARLAADQQEQALALAEPSDLRQTRRDPTRSFFFLGFLLYAVEDALLDAASIALALLPFGSRSRERRRWRPFSWFEEGTNVEH